MIANINKLRGKMYENGYTMKSLAPAVNLCVTTLRRKICYEGFEFTIGESLEIKEKLKLTTKEYLDIFFGNNLN